MLSSNPFKRFYSRASFLVTVPLVASIVAFILSVVFTAFHLSQSRSNYVHYVDQSRGLIADYIAESIVSGDTQTVDDFVSKFVDGRALVVFESGERYGRINPDLDRSEQVAGPIVHNGEVIAQLTYIPSIPYKPHLSLLQAAIAVGVCTLVAYLVMTVFSLRAKRFLRHLAEYLNDVRLNAPATASNLKSGFVEFRQLEMVAMRTKRRLAREVKMLQSQAEIDDRTGLHNQFYLKNQIEKTLQTADLQTPSALLLVTIEGLAELSTRVSGSNYLASLTRIGKELAECSNQASNELGQVIDSWTLACLPSDQFAILATGFTSRDDVAPLVRRIHGHLRNLSTELKLPLKLRASGSIVMLPDDGDSFSTIMQRAEATLQNLREQESGGFRFYSPKLERQNDAQAKLEGELRNAVAQGRFVPLFQPKIDLSTGKICGVEALARWQLDSGRLVSPGRFIDLAEEIGVIGAIGEQIMRRACKAAAGWAQAGHQLDLAVNVSPKQFTDDNLASTVLDALTSSGLPPRRLELEITESLAVEHPERVRSVLAPLRKMGIKLAVDDFGTGHSNLAVLTQFEFDVFKIDRQFVSGLPGDKQSQIIVDLMLDMAKSLHMRIVGEGIETPEQAAFMAQHGCHIGQGYLYSQPVSDKMITRMLDEQLRQDHPAKAKA